ncbi:MAG TPA: NYN domain-containing protein [bacterium]|nr:NYN domain-containing protein [bacterium]HOL66224.1 NYN domain-containing protein [bacterium]
MQKVGVFIDVQNIYLTTQALWREGRIKFGKINFARLRDYLKGEGAVVMLNAFTCYDPENEGQRSFINALALLGYRVISKPTRRLPDGSIKASVDLEMAIETLNLAPHLDKVVLVTGDGDFKTLVDCLCAAGKIVKVIGPANMTSPELIQAAHEFVNLHGIEGIGDLTGLGQSNSET